MQIVEAMKGGMFAFIDTFEGLVRTWNVDGQSVRPDHRMVAHTGFIVTGRKTGRLSQDSPRSRSWG